MSHAAGNFVPCPTRRENGLLVFDPHADVPPVTAELVCRIEDEESSGGAGLSLQRALQCPPGALPDRKDRG